MNLKNKLIISLVMFFLAAGAWAQLIDKPAASVNLSRPEMISVKQLEKQVGLINELRTRSGLPVAEAGKSDKLQVLDMMISDKLILQGAERDGVTASVSEIEQAVSAQKAQIEQQNGMMITEQQFRAAIEQQTGYSWDEYKGQLEKQIVQQKYLMEKKGAEMQAMIKMPGAEEIEKFYSRTEPVFPIRRCPIQPGVYKQY